MSSFTIRKAKLEDANELAHVHVSTWRSAYKGIVAQSFLDALDVDVRSKRWENILQSESDDINLVALKDNQIIGFASAGKSRENGDTEAELYAIYLLEAFAAKGYGSQLLKSIVDQLMIQKYSSLGVYALKDNPYKSFYTSHGAIYTHDKEFKIGEQTLMMEAYVWKDITTIFQDSTLK